MSERLTPTDDALTAIRTVAASKNLTMKEVAAAIGMPYDSFRNGLYGRSERAFQMIIERMKDKYGLPGYWPGSPPEGRPLNAMQMTPIPIIGSASAGPGADEEYEDELYVPSALVQPGSFGWLAEGDSFMPHIKPKDVVIATPAKEPKLHYIMLVRDQSGKVRVKEIGYEDNQFVLISANPKYETEPADGEIIGQVNAIYREEYGMTRFVSSMRGLRTVDLQ